MCFIVRVPEALTMPSSNSFFKVSWPMGRNLQSSYIYKWIQKLNNQRELIKLLWVFIFIFIFYYIFYLLGNIVSCLLKLMFWTGSMITCFKNYKHVCHKPWRVSLLVLSCGHWFSSQRATIVNGCCTHSEIFNGYISEHVFFFLSLST